MAERLTVCSCYSSGLVSFDVPFRVWGFWHLCFGGHCSPSCTSGNQSKLMERKTPQLASHGLMRGSASFICETCGEYKSSIQARTVHISYIRYIHVASLATSTVLMINTTSSSLTTAPGICWCSGHLLLIRAMPV